MSMCDTCTSAIMYVSEWSLCVRARVVTVCVCVSIDCECVAARCLGEWRLSTGARETRARRNDGIATERARERVRMSDSWRGASENIEWEEGSGERICMVEWRFGGKDGGGRGKIPGGRRERKKDDRTYATRSASDWRRAVKSRAGDGRRADRKGMTRPALGPGRVQIVYGGGLFSPGLVGVGGRAHGAWINIIVGGRKRAASIRACRTACTRTDVQGVRGSSL